MSSVKYCCTALMGTNKVGKIPVDANGYRKLLLGALNFHNSAGLYYDHESSKHVFEASNSFMRRVTSGNLYSEEDHPQFEPGMTEDQWLNRIRWIDSKNVCAHIRDIELDYSTTNKKGERVCIIYGSVKPDRERGPFLEAALNNPDQNVCFSLRSIIHDWRKGTEIYRTIDELVTFDWVIEPGISKADKWHAPGLESGSLLSRELHTQNIPIETVRRMANGQHQNRTGFESGVDNRIWNEIIQRVDQSRYAITKPAGIIQW